MENTSKWMERFLTGWKNNMKVNDKNCPEEHPDLLGVLYRASNYRHNDKIENKGNKILI